MDEKKRPTGPRQRPAVSTETPTKKQTTAKGPAAKPAEKLRMRVETEKAKEKHGGEPKKVLHKKVTAAAGTEVAATQKIKELKTERATLSQSELEKKERELKAKEEELARKEESLKRLEVTLRRKAEEATIRDAASSEQGAWEKLPSLQKRGRGPIDVMNGSAIWELTSMEHGAALRAFNELDRDGSGTIDAVELFEGLTTIYPGISRPEANRLYGMLDVNRDGTISFPEFLRGVFQYEWDLSLIKERERVRTSGASYEWEIPFDELHMITKLGEGSFGVVHRALWRSCAVAVKEVRPEKLDTQGIELFRKEVALLGSLRHPNVVLFMGASTHSPHLAIVTEFLPGGNLFDLLHTRKVRLTISQVLHLSRQTSLGLLYLHSLTPRLIHRDLKSENLLMDDHFRLKLCDFGLSCLEPVSGTLTERVGSPLWMSPEMLSRKAYTEKTDVWSYGTVLWETVSGEVPFGNITVFDELVDEVVNKGQRPAIGPGFPEDLAQIVLSCWETRPEKRPSMRQVVNRLDKAAAKLLSSK